MILLIFFFILSILFSFLCSIWEAVLLSITPSYIRKKQADGSEVGQLLTAYKEDIDKPLSAILTLNTIAHTVGAIGVGAQATAVFDNVNEIIPGLSWEVVIASFMTLAILILSEIIPKTIGANNWRGLAPFTVKSLRILLWILAPLVWITQLITKSLKNDKNKSVLSRSDIAAMAKEGAATGTLEQSESTIIRNLVQLHELKVNDIMTPRTVLTLANQNLTVREFFDKNEPLQFSRIPTYDGKEDLITGMVLKDEILTKLAEDQDEALLNSIKRPLVTVSDQLPLPILFDKLLQEKIHMSVVTDSYGSLVGIVTMEDLLETILGIEITDESDAVTDLQSLARKKWQDRAKKIGLIE